MSRFRIHKEHGDYIVESRDTDSYGEVVWKPLRNFGNRQSDAIEYRDCDAPKLTESKISFLTKTYSNKRKYKTVLNYYGRKVYRLQAEKNEGY